MSLDNGQAKKQKLREKLELMEKVANEMIESKHRLEQELKVAKTKTAEKVKKDPTPAQERVYNAFGQRSKKASIIYNSPGYQGTWGDAMREAGVTTTVQESETPDLDAIMSGVQELPL